MAAAVRLPDGSRWLGTSGDRVVGKGDKPVSVLTPFEIGSLTKTFVAALVLKLQEEGRLSLDQPISTWLPDYPLAKRITVRMLLSHRSGIYDYFSHPRYESKVFDRPRHRWTVNEILALRGPRYCRPDSCFRYSNTNYVLLGRIVKKVTGAPIARNLRDRFLFPLGLRDTFFQGQEPILKVPAEGYLATRKGYQRLADGSRFRPNTSAATVADAAGAMVSSVRDVSDWQDALAERQRAAAGFPGADAGHGSQERLRAGDALRDDWTASSASDTAVRCAASWPSCTGCTARTSTSSC